MIFKTNLPGAETKIAVTADAAEHLKTAALLVIDVQARYLNSHEYLKPIARNIESIVPEFRKAGIPVYAIHFTMMESLPADFDIFTPQAGDHIVRKTQISAFDGSNIHDLLKKEGKKNLYLCGFFASACVLQTAISAKFVDDVDYNVTILNDLTGDPAFLDTDFYMETVAPSHGIQVEKSSAVLKRMKPAR